MSREESVSPEGLPEQWNGIEHHRDWWKPFRINLLVLKNNSRWVMLTVLPVVFATVGLFEARTSEIEARVLSSIAAKLSYQIGPGPSQSIAFPAGGPFNESRGYAGLPEFERRLTDAGFRIVAQARLSPELERLAHWKITPPFREPAATGLVVRGENRTVLYDAGSREHIFRTYEDIPPVAAKALLLVENRELEDSSDFSTRNPVVDWGRLGKAGLMYAGHKLGLPFPVEGGSTLATQIEKFRYADGGRTSSATDKLRQMFSASLRVYRSGPDTRAERRQIVLDYMNSVPLAAAPAYGEVYGLGNGLHAWFGIDLDEARATLAEPGADAEKAHIFKHMMALICAARAPSFYLVTNRGALEARVDFYVRQLESNGAIPADFARNVAAVPLEFLPHAPTPQAIPFVERKATNAFRTHLLAQLGIPDLYTLDRLHLEADTTLNVHVQNEVLRLFRKMQDPAFVDAQGLRQKYLLPRGDPSRVTYSFTLFERTPAGNVLRVQADTLNQPFDLNEGMKLELGSTAKLRTLAHYLELVASLYHEFHDLDTPALTRKAQTVHDPITKWAAETMAGDRNIDLPTLLNRSLDRQYSGNPGEVFFTGGGAHVFANFEKEENGQSFNLRDGLAQSVNLVYIRLMRDIVHFHEARLTYDPDSILSNPDDPTRLQMLKEIADKESQHFLFEAFKDYRGQNLQAIVEKLLGTRSTSARHLAMLYFAWNARGDAAGLARSLQTLGVSVSNDEASHLLKSYDPARLNISDYAFLLNRNPLELWAAGQLAQDPSVSWDDLLKRSGDVREVASRWLFQTKNRTSPGSPTAHTCRGRCLCAHDSLLAASGVPLRSSCSVLRHRNWKFGGSPGRVGRINRHHCQ